VQTKQCDQVPRSSTILSRHLRTRGSVAATALLVFAWSAGTAQSHSSKMPALGPLMAAPEEAAIWQRQDQAFLLAL
jgi:hypothetical protein